MGQVVARQWRVTRCKAVLSFDAVAILVPSGEASTARTQLMCPVNSVTFSWLFASHTITKPSIVPLTIHLPSRDTATLKRTPLASIGSPSSSPSSTHQRRIFPPSPPLTMCFPSMRNATEYTLSLTSIMTGFTCFRCTAELFSLESWVLVNMVHSIISIIRSPSFVLWHISESEGILGQVSDRWTKGCARLFLVRHRHIIESILTPTITSCPLSPECTLDSCFSSSSL